MSIQHHVAMVGGHRVGIAERDLSGAESVFYVGRGESRVELRYDVERGVSVYECDAHGRRLCGHVRAIRVALGSTRAE